MADVAATFTLDGRLIGVGSFRRGFDIRGETDAGAHELQVRWSVVTQRFALYLPLPGVYRAELRYNRFWGKFVPVEGGIKIDVDRHSPQALPNPSTA